jgi:predicted MFS family arabinose efflux permease
VGLLNYVDRQVIFSVFPLLEKDLRVPASQLGLLTTVFAWVYGLLSPVAGYIADRFGRTRVILISLLVWSAVTTLTSQTSSMSGLLGSRALMGISEACYIPAALGLIAEYHGSRTRSLATGLHQSGLYIGIVLGGTAGGWIGERFGWRAAFLLMGSIGIAYFFVLRQGLPRDRREATQRTAALWPTIVELAKLSGFWRLSTAFSAVALANWVAYTWLPLYLYESFDMSLVEAGFTATFYMQAGSFSGIVLGGWLADRWATRSSRGRVLTQATGLALMAPFLFLAAIAHQRGWLIGGLLAFGLGRGLYDCNTMPVLCEIARPEIRSTGYGIFNLSSCIVGGITAGSAGLLKETLGLSTSFQIAAVLLLLCIWPLVTVRIQFRAVPRL